MRWILAVVVMARVAHADDPERGGFIGKERPLLEIDDCPVTAVAVDQLQRVAREHYERGEVLYLQGDFSGAESELVSSYCLTPYYSILKDIGQAFERELAYDKAIAYYEKYYVAVPKDAKRASACATDPQDDKRIVYARIQVLKNLRATVRIDTDPPGTRITLSNDAGIEARGTSGDELAVGGGRYEMSIDKAGFQPIRREIRTEIGKPYTYFERLDPKKGRLRVRVIPADARLFFDKKQVGISGAYDTELAGGRYTISAEAQDHVTVSREIEVLPDRDTPLTFELPAQPEFGRRQLLLYASLGGGAAGSLLAGAQDNRYFILGALGAGGAAGLFAAYYGTPSDIALGTSSTTVTSSLIGGTVGGALATIISSNGNFAAPMIGGGLVLGAGVGYYVGDRLHVRPGEAAIVNSGALWGAVTGTLFYGSFDPGARIGGGLVLSGLAMGTLGGVLITKYFTVSRARAALIDVGGVVGLLVGLAAQNIVNQTAGTSSQQRERGANYALGGMATGLVLSGILTRNLDDPNLGVTPVIQHTTGVGATTTFGVGGSF